MGNVVKKLMAVGIVGCMALTGCGQADNNLATEIELDPKEPTYVTVWNYYNGDQLAAFEDMVSEFNETVGADKGIVVTSVSQGSIENLVDCLEDALEGKTGAEDVPTIASVYAETAYELDKAEQLVALDDYFTEEELDNYIPGFISEGRLIEDGPLMIFPISKSTECFAVNKTDMTEFEAETGVSLTDIATVEDLTDVAQKYYEWTDGLTPDVAEDGKAFYGRDSIANYLFIGTKQLGHEMFKVTKDGVEVDLDKEVFRKLWDNYYIPYINGYFTKEANYRSEDMKTGSILSLTGSTSSVSYLPTAVTNENDETHDISVEIYPQLCFKDAESETFVQQGAGYAVVKTTKEQQYAAVTFLKWVTQADRNLEFSILSGYSPVTVEGNDVTRIKQHFNQTDASKKESNIMQSLLISADVFSNKETYTSKPFHNSRDIRNLLETSFGDIAQNDREAVVQAINEGKTRQEAVAKFCSDEYFESWFDSLCKEVNNMIGK